MTTGTEQERWVAYLDERVGTYERRTARYAGVADRLELLGLAPGDLIVDVGAGMCEFARYLYTARGWTGRYAAVDGAIQGVDLNSWEPDFPADFFVAIELLEHLERPDRLVAAMAARARKGIVATTPNTDELGVRFVKAMDRTHVHPLTAAALKRTGALVDVRSFFGRPGDTIVATWTPGTRVLYPAET